VISTQVSYNKKCGNETVSLKRESSVRKLQDQHYIVLDKKSLEGEQIAEAPPQRPIRTHTKKSNI